MYVESDLACGGNGEDPDTPTHSDGEDRDEEPMAPLANTLEDMTSDLDPSTGKTTPESSTRDRFSVFQHGVRGPPGVLERAPEVSQQNVDSHDCFD